MATPSPLPAVRAVADVAVGDALPALTVHVDRPRLVQYAGASLDRERPERFDHLPEERIAPELRLRHVANRPRRREREQPWIEHRLVIGDEDRPVG